MTKSSNARRIRKLSGPVGKHDIALSPEDRTVAAVRHTDVVKAELTLKGAHERVREFANEVQVKYAEGGRYTVTNVDLVTGVVTRTPNVPQPVNKPPKDEPAGS